MNKAEPLKYVFISLPILLLSIIVPNNILWLLHIHQVQRIAAIKYADESQCSH